MLGFIEIRYCTAVLTHDLWHRGVFETGDVCCIAVVLHALWVVLSHDQLIVAA